MSLPVAALGIGLHFGAEKLHTDGRITAGFKDKLQTINAVATGALAAVPTVAMLGDC